MKLERSVQSGAEGKCQGEHETAVRNYQLPGRAIVDGWRCWNCGYEWGFEFLREEILEAGVEE